MDNPGRTRQSAVTVFAAGVVAVLAIAGLRAIAARVAAQSTGRSVQLSQSSVMPGGDLHLVGSGFHPGNCMARAVWDDPGSYSFRFYIPTSGEFDEPFMVPLDSSLGSHNLTLYLEDPCIRPGLEFDMTRLPVAVVALAPARMPVPQAGPPAAETLLEADFTRTADGAAVTAVRVVTGSTPNHVGAPRHLRVIAQDVNRQALSEYDMWDPRQRDYYDEQGRNHTTTNVTGTGTIAVPFTRSLGTLSVYDISRIDPPDPGEEDVLPPPLVTQDLRPLVETWCEQHPGAPECVPVGPTLTYDPCAIKVDVTQVVSLGLRLNNVRDIYGLQVDGTFDKGIVTVVDADPAQPGTQLAPGDFLAPGGPDNAVVLINRADNSAGTFTWSSSLEGARKGLSGGGTVAWVPFRGMAAGTSRVGFGQVVLSDPQSQPVAAVPVACAITVVQPEEDVDTSLVDVTGRLVLERRGSNVGANVCACSDSAQAQCTLGPDEAKCVESKPDGSYQLTDVRPGPVEISHGSYLRSRGKIADDVGETLALPLLTLLAGDVDQDDFVGDLDLVMVAQSWDQRLGGQRWSPERDITADGVINVLDAVAVKYNWTQAGPRAIAGLGGEVYANHWEPPHVFGYEPVAGAVGGQPGDLDGASGRIAQAAEPTLAFAPADQQVGVGDEATVDLMIQNAVNVFAYHVVVNFDPAVLQVLDVNRTEDGVQVSVGTFLDENSLFVGSNSADNEEGFIDLMVTQTYPAAGRNGGGVLGRVTFVARGGAESRLDIEEATLFDDSFPTPQETQPQASAGRIRVGGGGIYLPYLQRKR